MAVSFMECRFGLNDIAVKLKKVRNVGVRGTVRGSGFGRQSRATTTDSEDEEPTEDSLKNESRDTKTPECKRKRKRNEDGIAESLKAEIIEGFDPGMTGAGTSVAFKTQDPDRVDCEMRWPGKETENFLKATMTIAYRRDNPGREAEFQENESLFAFEIKPGMRQHAFCKTIMDEDAPPSKYNDPIFDGAAATILMRQPEGIDRRQVMVDCMKNLYQIQLRRFDEQNGAGFLNGVKQTIVLTYPAACSEKGRANTRRAAVEAGWQTRGPNSLRMISEARAAAYAAFASNRKKYGTLAWRDVFKAQTLVLILDIGGLTVDAATLLIKALDPFMVVDEICAPDGGKCGVIAIYCRIYELMIKLFGDHFAGLPLESIGHGSRFMKAIETLLRNFNGTNLDREIHLHLLMEGVTAHKNYDEAEGLVLITGHDIKKILDETVRKIIAIAEGQIALALAYRKLLMQKGVVFPRGAGEIHTVICCGGGSLLPYIFSEVTEFCNHYHGGKMDLIRPDDPLSAVARGAVMAFLEKSIVGNRIVGACYGVKVHKKFEVGDSADAVTFTCPVGGKRADGFVSWHVHKGTQIDTRHRVQGQRAPTVDGYVVIDLSYLDDESKGLKIPIYKFDGENPPNRSNAPGVSKVGDIEITPYYISDYKKKKLRKASEKGKLQLQIQQVVDTTKGVLEFVASVGRTQIGFYELTYEATQKA